MIYLDEYVSPVGALSLASDGPCLCGIWLAGQRHFQEKLALRVGAEVEADGLDRQEEVVTGKEARKAAFGLRAARAWLDAYFAHPGTDPGPLPPVAWHGTPFQEEVWAQLARIPYGRLTTYGAIAKAITAGRSDGTKASARAVGVAVGRNPVSIVVPCHRVIGASGGLTGYAGGIERKIALLEIEGVETRDPFGYLVI